MGTLYATIDDLRSIGPRTRTALGWVPADKIKAALWAASDLADGFLAPNYQLPLVAWGSDLRNAVAVIALADLFYGDALLAARERAVDWLDKVSKREERLVGARDARA